MNLPVRFRGYEGGDEAKVYSDWLKSYEETFFVTKVLPYRREAVLSANKLFKRLEGLKDEGEKVKCRSVLRKLYYAEHHELVRAVLGHPSTTVGVCCSQEDPLIFGWCVTSEAVPRMRVMHYLYVGELYRRMGIGSELLRRSGARRYTHMTLAGNELVRAMFHGEDDDGQLDYDPGAFQMRMEVAHERA